MYRVHFSILNLQYKLFILLYNSKRCVLGLILLPNLRWVDWILNLINDMINFVEKTVGNIFHVFSQYKKVFPNTSQLGRSLSKFYSQARYAYNGSKSPNFDYIFMSR